MPSRLWKLSPVIIIVLFLAAHAFANHMARPTHLLSVCADGKQCTVKVQRVIDGDTFVTVTSHRVRVDSFNATELDMPGGPTARACLEEALMHLNDGWVTIRVTGVDTYGRTLARVLDPSLEECQ